MAVVQLRQRRLERGWTLDDVVDQLHRLAHEIGEPVPGVDRQAVSRWERGTHRPRAYYVRMLSMLYQTSPLELGLVDQVEQHTRVIRSPHDLIAQCPDGSIGSTSRAWEASPTWPTSSLLTREHVFLMHRRDFLAHMLGVGLAIAGVPATNHEWLVPHLRDPDELLQHSGGTIQACWSLLKGPDLGGVPSLLVDWLPQLDVAVQPDSALRPELAKHSSEAYIIAGLVAVLQGRNAESEWCCKQACAHAELSGDPALQVAALKHLATKYQSARVPLLALRTYERALPFASDASPLLRGRTYLGIALAHAECGDQHEAEANLAMAHELFPEHPEKDPAYRYADCNRSSLHHYGGLIHLQFADPASAWEVFDGALHDPSLGLVPDRTVVEITNCQARAAIEAADLELACHHLEAGIRGAHRLQSQMRLQESLDLSRMVESRWPREQKARQLEALLRG